MVWYIPPCSNKVFSAFLALIYDMEELSLIYYDPRFVVEEDTSSEFSLTQERFSRLKCLSLCGSADVTGILDHPKLSEERLQAFVNRQTKLKSFSLTRGRHLSLNHLVLDKLELSNCAYEDDELAAPLKNQTKLRHLKCGPVGLAAFNKLKKMKILEVLHCNLPEKVIGELKNLKELGLLEINSIQRRGLVLPKLEKLSLDVNIMETDHFVPLSRSAQNLQRIGIRSATVKFLPLILEHFPALKTMFVNSPPSNETFFCLPPSRPNLNLEELLIFKPFRIAPMKSVYETINACPNLKRIQLHGASFTGQQVLGSLRNCQHLTHFWLV